jgi:hypothetical protein
VCCEFNNFIQGDEQPPGLPSSTPPPVTGSSNSRRGSLAISTKPASGSTSNNNSNSSININNSNNSITPRADGLKLAHVQLQYDSVSGKGRLAKIITDAMVMPSEPDAQAGERVVIETLQGTSGRGWGEY